MRHLHRFIFIPLLLLAACLHPATMRALELPPGCAAWGHLPLTVAVDESAVDYRSDVNRGMKAWNEAMHRPAFVWAYVAQAEPDVIVAVGPMHHRLERGYAAAACANGHVLSTVVLKPGLDVGAVTTYATHELGHVLGLGHAPNEHSVMHATIEADLLGQWDDEHAPQFYRILPNDARLAVALHTEDFASADESVKPPPEGGVIIQAQPATPVDPWAEFGAGHYVMGLVLLLIAALSLAKKVVPSLFSSDYAGAATAFLGSFLGALATNGATALSWGGMKAAFVVAVLAMGGYSVLWRKLLKPALKALADKLGVTWASKVLS